MTQEELLFKAGLDHQGFDSALRNITVKMKEFGEHASEHMDHAAMSGRMLHRIIEQISEVSPLAGAALVGAFSLPMLALEGLMMGIKAISEGFEKAKEAAKEMALEARKAFTEGYSGPIIGAREAGAAKGDRRRELGYLTPEDAATLDAIQSQKSRVEQAQKAEEAAKKDLENAKPHDVAFLKQFWMDRFLQLETERKTLEDLQQADKDRLESAREFEKEAAANAEKEIERKKKLKEHDKEAIEIGQRAATIVRRRAELGNAPYTPSLSEMSGYNTPYGFLAKELIAAQNFTKYASTTTGASEAGALGYRWRQLYGTFQAERAQAIAADSPDALTRAGRKYSEGLRSMMGGHLPPDVSLEGILDEMKSLNMYASEKGFVIQWPTD